MACAVIMQPGLLCATSLAALSQKNLHRQSLKEVRCAPTSFDYHHEGCCGYAGTSLPDDPQANRN
jgi:hypothetical protein